MTDRSGNPPTSDDLIRRARRGLGADAGPASGATNGDGAKPLPVREPIRPDPVDRFAESDPFADQYVPGGGDATEPEYEPYSPTSAPRETAAATVMRKFGGLILIGVLALGGVLWRALDGTKSVETLEQGDCLQEPDTELITSVETVDCSEAHDYEVYAVIQLPQSGDAPYPGDEETFFSTLEACLPSFDAYVGIAYMESIYDINTIYPTRESWEDEGDREATCLLAEYTFSGNIAPTTGSVRSTGV